MESLEEAKDMAKKKKPKGIFTKKYDNALKKHIALRLIVKALGGIGLAY